MKSKCCGKKVVFSGNKIKKYKCSKCKKYCEAFGIEPKIRALLLLLFSKEYYLITDKAFQSNYIVKGNSIIKQLSVETVRAHMETLKKGEL